MELKRIISVYKKNSDEFLSEYSLNDVPLNRLKAIITLKDDDSELFDV